MEILFWALVGIVAYVYFGYPLLVVALGLLRRQPHSRELPDDALPYASLLVVAHNEEAVLREKLENSLALDYPSDRFQIVVASDASTDATDSIALEYADRGVCLIRRPTRGSQTGAQNYAAPQAKGAIIVFSDANSMYHPQALRELVKPFADASVGCVVGRLSHTNPHSSSASYGEALYWRYESALKWAQSRARALLFANGAIYAVRKSLYDPVDPRFDHDTMVPLRCLRAGYRVVYQPSAIAYEEASSETVREFRRRVRIMIRDAWTFISLRFLLADLWLTFHLVSHKILRWSVGALAIGILVVNLFLLGEHVLYQVTLAGQLAFYAVAATGLLFQANPSAPRVVKIPFFFCMANVAFLTAFAKMALGERMTTWQPRDW